MTRNAWRLLWIFYCSSYILQILLIDRILIFITNSTVLVTKFLLNEVLRFEVFDNFYFLISVLKFLHTMRKKKYDDDMLFTNLNLWLKIFLSDFFNTCFHYLILFTFTTFTTLTTFTIFTIFTTFTTFTTFTYIFLRLLRYLRIFRLI